MTSYTKGLHEVADGVWAWLQPDGGWGWSNAGLVADGGASLLVDTLFDLPRTAEMLDTMRSAVPAARSIGTLVNTHANGDHCFGNQLVDGAEIVSSAACAEEMASSGPERLAALLRAAPTMGATGDFVQAAFGEFEFEGIELALPSRTFAGSLDLRVGDRTVELVELGPAHTLGDVVVHVPDQRVVYTGDLVFNGGHPIVWAGPVEGWIAACDRLLAMAPEVVVPGHGPVAGPEVVRTQRGYFEWLLAEARPRFEAGMAPLDAARDVDPGEYAGWGESERLAVNLARLWRDWGADLGAGESAFADMATLWHERRRG